MSSSFSLQRCCPPLLSRLGTGAARDHAIAEREEWSERELEGKTETEMVRKESIYRPTQLTKYAECKFRKRHPLARLICWIDSSTCEYRRQVKFKWNLELKRAEFTNYSDVRHSHRAITDNKGVFLVYHGHWYLLTVNLTLYQLRL